MASTSIEDVCLGKDVHPTKEAAARAAKIQRSTKGGVWSSYKCPFCGNHHVGHEARVHGDRQSRRARKQRQRA